MSANAVIAEHVFGLGVPPYEDPALYQRNSPIAYVKDVDTPLLAIHGEFDMRGSPAQAEEFFYSLYRQGKTAKLLRYWGESHGLSQSPANVRNIFDESLGWFDRYLKYKYNDNKHTAR
jgi:dipeptidyl aminopeptidase/acylaminoacyl peptidase